MRSKNLPIGNLRSGELSVLRFKLPLDGTINHSLDSSAISVLDGQSRCGVVPKLEVLVAKPDQRFLIPRAYGQRDQSCWGLSWAKTLNGWPFPNGRGLRYPSIGSGGSYTVLIMAVH